MPSEISATAAVTTGRTPKRLMKAAENGAIRPKRRMRRASAEEMSAALQPNSFSSGTMMTPGRAHRSSRRQHDEEGRSRDGPAIVEVPRRHRRGERVGQGERRELPLRQRRGRKPPGRRRCGHLQLLFLRVSTRVSAKKSQAQRKRPQLLSPAGAQRGLDPPLRFLPEGSGQSQRLYASGRKPHGRLPPVLRRDRAHEAKLLQRLHVAPDRRPVEFGDAARARSAKPFRARSIFLSRLYCARVRPAGSSAES